MKRINSILLAILGITAIACSKNESPVAPAVEQNLIHKTFTVSAPDGTKTALGTDGLTINWSDGDEINVIGLTADGTAAQHTFTLTSGAGTSSATFEGSVGTDEVTFYAFYPASIELDLADSNNPLSKGDITVKRALSQDIPAVLNGFSASHAMMTAKADADNKLAFRHGVAFLKVQIGMDDISSVLFEASSGRPGGRPSYSAETGATTNVQSAKNNVTLVADGTFTKDGIYYIPVQTRPNTKIGTLTLTFTRSDGEESVISTTALNNLILQSGLVYDLKCPVVSFDPIINAEDVSLDAKATEGAITYTIERPVDGGVVRASLTEASDWLTVGPVSEGSIALTTTVNTGAPRSADVTLYYNYSGKVITKDVTVTQRASGTVEFHEYLFYIDSSKKTVQTKDGEACEYFTPAGGTADLGGDYKITDWELNGVTSTKGWKINSSGKVTFTTSSTLNSTVQFWFIRRKSGDTTAKIQLVPAGGTATVLDTPYDTIGNSGKIELQKGTQYTIQQGAKEQALLMIKVTEKQ